MVVNMHKSELQELISESINEILSEMEEPRDEGNVYDVKSTHNYGSQGGKVEIVTHDNGTIEIKFNSVGKFSKEECEIAYDTFMGKVKPFINSAKKNGFTLLTQKTTPKSSFVRHQNDYFDVDGHKQKGYDVIDYSFSCYLKIIDENGNVSDTVAKQGYEYCATVVPIEENEKSGIKVDALVTMAPKYRNSNLSSLLSSTMVAEKCAGCGRTSGRSQYIVYINTTTGQLIKLGTHCAVSKFGYALTGGKFIERLAMMFNTCNYHDLVAHDPDGFAIPPSLSLRQMSSQNYVSQVMKVVAYHISLNPYFKFKEYGYDELKDDSLIMTVYSEDGKGYYKYDPIKHERIYMKFNQKQLEMRSWYEANGSNLPSVNEYIQYWQEMNPMGDFETSCKTVALACASEAFIPSKNASKFEHILPYTISAFLKNKDKQNTEEELGFKVGDDISGIRCKLVDTKYSDKYNAYIVKLQDNDGNVYAYWSNYDTAGLGDQDLVISTATVKTIRNGEVSLSRARVISQSKQIAINKRNEETASMNYPDSGFRYRNAKFKVDVIKRNDNEEPSSATVEDENGCKYYIFLIKSYEGFGTKRIDFPYNEGDTITLSGTAERKEGRNGVYYTLSRVKLQ